VVPHRRLEMMLERVRACVKAHAPLPFQPRKKRVAAGDRCQQLGAVGMDEHPDSAMVEQAPPLPQGVQEARFQSARERNCPQPPCVVEKMIEDVMDRISRRAN